MRFAALLATALVAGTALLAQTAPHTTHYPRHGGIFFPAKGDTLHLEGAWPQQRVFKLYVYDTESRPLAVDRLKTISASVTVNGRTSPLLLREAEQFFEGRIPTLTVPGELQLQLTYAPGETEGFYFIFPAYSDESALTFALEPTVIQTSLDDLLDAVRGDLRDVCALIERRQAGFGFAPATRIRDRALALERYLPSNDARPRAEAAVRELVRAAWLLHLASDEGTLAQVQAAVEQATTALDETIAAFERVGR